MNVERFQWQSCYNLDIEDIDYQHHFFLNLINRLAEELLNTQGYIYRASLISELNAYAKFHFLSEENMMRREGFPALDEHRKHHQELIEQLNAKEYVLLTKGSDDDAQAVIDFLADWFVHHTMQEDRLFADFVHGTQNSIP